MTVYKDCVCLILKDGRVIVCQSNGYEVRTLESSFGKSVTDSNFNSYGPVYWKKQAMKELGVHSEDILMQAKDRVCFND